MEAGAVARGADGGAAVSNFPKTRAEAEAYRYDKWVGNPGGTRYNAGRCAAEVPDGTGWHRCQCQRKPGKGPDGLYCKQHAKMIGAR